MATSVRTLFKFLIGLFAALQAAVIPSRADHSRPEAPSRSNASAMSAFMARLLQETDLRARFSRNPRAVLRQHGIDPAPYNLPDRMNEADLRRLLSGRTYRLAEGAPNPPAPETGQPKEPPAAPVYGPPPSPRPDAGPPPPSPSAPVYGPPPGLPPQR